MYYSFVILTFYLSFVYMLRIKVKCREEDMKQRKLENERHAIEDARRSVDEKAQQLKVLANQSALFAGFSMVVLVETTIPTNVNVILLTIFGGTTATVIGLMLVSSLYATYMLVAILRYDCVRRDVPFDDFWRKRCDPDFKLSLRCFSNGVPLFMLVVALVAWMNFWSSSYVYISASIVTAIALAVAVYWFKSIDRKWMSFLLMSHARILTRPPIKPAALLRRPSWGTAKQGSSSSDAHHQGKQNENGGNDSSNVMQESAV
jgi:hypothetical protein